MSKFKKFMKSPAPIIILFVIAAALVITGGIGGSQAALRIFSQEYSSRVSMRDIGISLLENHEMVGQRDYIPDSDFQWNDTGSHRLCENLLGEDEQLKIGKEYDEPLSVRNSGNINVYARVNVYKYWADVDEQGNVIRKRPDLDPTLIDLNLLGAENGWLEAEGDNNAEGFSPERTVLYYNRILAPGEESALFADKLTIDGGVALKVSTETHVDEEGYTVVTTTYAYNGAQFIIEAEVDAVQTHNAAAAILSAWGRNVDIDGNGVITRVY